VRRQWIEDAFPDATVVTLDQDASGLSDEDTTAWARETVRVLGGPPDVVFTSERYGNAWARAMGAEHVLVDRRRRTVPISATRIRRDPQRHFGYLSRGARAHYVKRVCLLGAESTGKTTLARALADHYGTVWNPEFGHVYSWFRSEPAEDWSTWTTAELVEVAQIQNWYEDFLGAYANRVLFCDTNAWTTGLFHELYLGRRTADIDRLADREYDLYIVCDPATPFAQDEFGTRRDGPHRTSMHEAYVRHLEEIGASYVVVSGTHAQRMRTAVAAVDRTLKSAIAA
jgi:HTH-type transcriptional regulator, transcriptional repressor of NAD biosynthesis genes